MFEHGKINNTNAVALEWFGIMYVGPTETNKILLDVVFHVMSVKRRGWWAKSNAWLRVGLLNDKLTIFVVT